MTCRVCGLPLDNADATFDPESDYSNWPVVIWPYFIHRQCLARAAKEMAERLQREQR